MITFRSAYLKLTWFYVLVVMLISMAFSVAVYNISTAEIDRGLNRQTQFITNFPVNSSDIDFQSLEENRQAQAQKSAKAIELDLFYFNLFILMISSVSAYFFAKKTLQPIEEMVEAQNRFTADASHELRTPLTAMRSEIEVSLRDKKMSLADAKNLLNSNLDEISKLESLSNALLKLAKYEDQVKLEFGQVDLPGILAEAYEKIESLAKKKSIEFENIVAEAKVWGDHASLVEVFVILFENAIKYSPENSTVTVNTSKKERSVLISVKDWGCGIKKSDLPLIFNRFFRSDNSRAKTKIDGYGLGLSIAKSIVDLHDGNISVESTVGSGTTFTISLPTAHQTEK